MVETSSAYEILVGKPEHKNRLGRLRRTWEDSTIMDLKELGYKDVDCIYLAQDTGRRQTVMNLQVP
jgi:hypothetical protein